MLEALCEAVLDAGAPHLMCDEGWVGLFNAVCNECGAMAQAVWRGRSGGSGSGVRSERCANQNMRCSGKAGFPGIARVLASWMRV